MFEILSNWRFWSLLIVGTLPLGMCLIAGVVVLVEKKLDEVLQRR